MTIKQLLNKTYKSTSLTPGEVDLLLAKSLHKPIEFIYKNPLKLVRRSTILAFGRTLERAKKGYSIAYLLGYKEFYGRKFRVNKYTLIPRPASEVIVKQSLDWLKENKSNCPKIVDIGTGSGCLIISLAAEYDGPAQYFASDISSPALAAARTNARKILPNKKVKFIKSNLLQNISEKYNLIIANLPYLTAEQMAEQSIKKEPRRALYGGADGLDYYKKLLSNIADHLEKKYLILFEIDPEQVVKITSLIKKALPSGKVSVIKDLENLDRVVKITD